MRCVPGERGVCVRQRVSELLLLQERVCAHGGHVDVPDLRSRDVQQPAGSHGVLELLGRDVLCELWSDRQRDVPDVPRGTVVAGGQPELQSVPRELARGCGQWISAELHVRQGLHWR